ncbi:MAG: hypothetical protein HUJ51_00345, partial [Eggerthellaceae bacterium]|nr:hypothetical protein [Eggerthellaceae bacterium]
MSEKIKDKIEQAKDCSKTNLLFVTIPLIIILFLEFGIFNLNFWQTCNLHEVNLTEQSRVSTSKWLIPAQGDVKTLNINVKTKMTIRIFISDEGHGQYTQVASISPDPNNPDGETVMLNNYGKVNSIMLLPINNSDAEDNVEKDLTTNRVTDMTQIESVSANKAMPFVLSGFMLTVMLAIYVFIVIFRPNSKIYKLKAKSKLGKRTLICLGAFLCVAAAWYTFNSPAAGQFTFDDNGNY